MPTNSYDLIVIGDDFAGLVAATLCARRGMRVLALSDGAYRAGYQIGPHRLPVEPLSFTGLSSPAVKRVLDELHFQHTIKRKLRPSRIGFQLVTPHARLDVGPNDDVLTAELARELPGVDDAMAAITAASGVAGHLDDVLRQPTELPPTGFWKRRELNKAAPKLAEEAAAWSVEADVHPLLAAMTSLPSALGTRTAAGDVSPAARARSFHIWRQGAARLRGDWSALRELFTEALVKSNGETRTARLAELTWSWGKVSGVRLDSGEELGASHIIAAMPVDKLLSLVERKPPKRLIQCDEAIDVVGYRYTLNLVVNEAGIPEGMGSPVLVSADPSAPPVGDNAVAIHLDDPDDEARVVVTVSAVCPAPERDDGLDDALADLRVRLRERIEMVMPFFSRHVLLAHSPHETAPPEGTRHELGRGFPIPPRPVWESRLEAALGVSAVPYGIGVKNLTVASNQVLPQLGIEGEFATGWYAARIACDAAGKKRDYLKDEVIAGG